MICEVNGITSRKFNKKRYFMKRIILFFDGRAFSGFL